MGSLSVRSFLRGNKAGLTALYVVECLVVGDEVGQVHGLAVGGDGTSSGGGIEGHCARDSSAVVLSCISNTSKGTHSVCLCVGERSEREFADETRLALTFRSDSQRGRSVGLEEQSESVIMFSRYETLRST